MPTLLRLFGADIKTAIEPEPSLCDAGDMEQETDALMYLLIPAIVTIGVAGAGDHEIVACLEAGLACRIAHTPTALFA